MDEDTTKLDLRSLDIAEEKRRELLRLFPEVRTEGGKIDFERLKRTLGETVDAGKERYGMNWPGKADCFRTIQAPSMATLRPCKEESVNWDTTENLIIEGDNLEVLKLLQKAYLGKVKMIYIDPPYNTGNDFIYPDNYSESLQTYFEYTGQVDDQGKKFGTNLETDGRFHSKWASTMYSRLFLARNLLRNDGAIFVSIDDNEECHLHQLLDEIFGEEQYLATLYVQVRYEGKTLVEDSDFQKLIEQVLVYGKSSLTKLNKQAEDYSFDKFCWAVRELGQPREMELGGKLVHVFPPGTFEISKIEPSEEGLKEVWASGKVLDGNSSGRFFRDYLEGRVAVDGLGVLYKVHGIGDDGLGFRYLTGPRREGATKGKYYQGVPQRRLLDRESKSETPIPCFFNFADAFGNCRTEGNVDFRNGKKPVAFLRKLLELGTNLNSDDTVLDFFAGSGSTAHAVLERNLTEGSRLKFILVQLPEPTRTLDAGGTWNESSPWKAGFKTISDLTMARVRNAIDVLRGDHSTLPLTDHVQDLGFRSFTLSDSNLLPWSAVAPSDTASVAEQLDLHIHHVRPNRTAEDLLFEILLKEGYPPNTHVASETAGDKAFFSVSDGGLFVCLEQQLSFDSIRAMAGMGPQRVVCLDEGFAGNDQLKANAVQIFKSKNIVFRTV